MSKYKIDIQIKGYCSHTKIINQLSKLFSAKPGDEIEIFIDIDPSSSFLYPDHLLLISSALNSTSERGVNITGEFYCKPECEDYVSRMNFFDSLGITFVERFTRQDSAGRFLEISKFGKEGNGNELINRVLYILKNQNLSEGSLLATISFCLGELVGNVIEHSANKGEDPIGWIVAQYYPKRNKIRIMVADNGQGIHKSLTEPEKSAFRSYTPKLAVENCIVKGVTNGNGLGNGLYATANFVQCNGGELLVHSGTWALTVKNGIKDISSTHNWLGTVVFLELQSNVSVDPSQILDGYTDYVDDYEDWFS